MNSEIVFSKYYGQAGVEGIDSYVKNESGYTALKKSLEMGKDKVLQEVKDSNLRGRGGAGFPCGTKWGFIPKNSEKPKYLVINADESEPGTFKDRAIMTYQPHLMIEGAIIAAMTIDAHTIYCYIRGEYVKEAEILEKAIDEAYKAATARLSTPRLTRVLQAAVERQQPPRAGQVRPKMRYAHQGGMNPPIIVIHGNSLEHVTEVYKRYLEGRFRDHFKLVGTPLRIEMKLSRNPFDESEH